MNRLTILIFIGAYFGGAPGIAEAQDYKQVLNSYLGQMLILQSYGESKHVAIKARNLKYTAGHCDVAVEVLDVRNERNKITFRLEQIGRIRTGGKSRCSNVWKETEFIITDLRDITQETLVSDLQEVFLTPEAYLEKNGHPTSLDQSQLNGPMKPPKVVLEIIPMLTDEKRQDPNRSKISLVIISVTVGTDGVIHSPHIIRDPGFGLGKQSLRVLPLWRFEQGRKGDKAINVTTELEFSFAAF
jgi:hypothetical protein